VFQDLIQYNIGPVFDTLVEETTGEIHLSFYVHKKLTDFAAKSSIADMKQLLDTLFAALRHILLVDVTTQHY